jgi:uncharacterized protein
MHENGRGVFLLSLRAHGDSTGETDDFGFSARQDVVAAVEWLERHHPGRAIVLFGTSQGAAAMAFAAGELGNRIRGYILECPYQDLKTAVRNRIEIYLPSPLDHVAFCGLLAVAPLFIANVDEISPASAIREVPEDVPVLILAGGADRRARPDEARAIQQSLLSHATLEIFEHGDHSQLFQSDPRRFKAVIGQFIQQATSLSP